MNAQTVISTLQARGFSLAPTEGGISVKPSKLLTDADRAAIREHKAELLSLLSPPTSRLLSTATLETERRLESGVPPCCGSRFTRGIRPARCISCDLAWPDEDLTALRAYLQQKREGAKAA